VLPQLPLVIEVGGQVQEKIAKIGRHSIQPANIKIKSVTQQFVIGHFAAVDIRLDGKADQVVTGILLALGDHFAQVAGDLAHTVGHYLGLAGVQQHPLPG